MDNPVRMVLAGATCLGAIGLGAFLMIAEDTHAATFPHNMMLINVETRKCLTIAGGTSTENNVVAVQFTCDTHASRRWRIIDAGGSFQIRNLHTGKCLTIAGGVSEENNVRALQFDCDDHPSRRWQIRRVGDVFKIVNAQTRKCLTIAGGVSRENNVEALQFTCDSHPSRTWQLKSAVIID